mmetsp:Transcript_36766/g.88593  ORF Transcript_36766/g.88593 Transcript_36766/m.88593 type:complete len:113 (-) Transcript_36766:518-856(-)
MNNLSDKISTNVGGLSVDTSTDTTEHGNGRSAQTVSCQTLSEVNPIFGKGIMDAEGEEAQVKHEDSKTAECKAHDGTGTEGGVETESPARFLGTNGGPDIGVDGHLHTEVAR